MATRIYGANPGSQMSTGVSEAIGPTATSGVVAVVVNLAATVTDASGTRGPNLMDVLDCLEAIKAHIMNVNKWPPA